MHGGLVALIMIILLLMAGVSKISIVLDGEERTQAWQPDTPYWPRHRGPGLLWIDGEASDYRRAGPLHSLSQRHPILAQTCSIPG